MKIRKGFVTNSSSSSFILAFKNEEELKNLKCDIKYFQRLYDDCMNEKNHVSMEDAIEFYMDANEYEMLYDLHCELQCKMHMSDVEFDNWMNVTNCTEYNKICYEMFCSEKETLRKQLEGKEIISIVNYSDDVNKLEEELEHNVVPNLEQCVKVVSYH